MSAQPPGERRSWLRAADAMSSGAGLAGLFVAGLILRLLLAQTEGFPFDIATFSAWADRLAHTGPWNFYPEADEEFFVDYPPGYLYVLWGLGALSQLLTDSPPAPFLLKLPAIFADLGVAWFAVLLADRLTPPALRRAFPYRGIVAASILLNPAVFFISAVWGQVESVQAFLILGGFLLVGTGAPVFRREAAGVALLAAAIATKPQAAFVVPFVVLVLAWRHLWEDVRERPGAEPAIRSVAVGLGRMAGYGLVAFGTGMVLMAPFGLGPVGAFRFYAEATETYAVTSVFAFNLWGAVGFWRPDVAGEDAVRVLGVPAFHVGLAAFSVGAIVLLVRGWRSLSRGELDGRILIFGTVAITCLAFAVLTRIHERYLFLALACLAPFLAYRWLRRSFVVLSAAYLVNVYFPYVFYLEQVGREAPTIEPLFRAVYGTHLGSVQLRGLSIAIAVLCLALAALGWWWLERRSGATEGPAPGARVPTVPAAVGGTDVPDRPPAPPAAPPPDRGVRSWRLTLHPVGRRGGAAALAAFLVVLTTRLWGLGDPAGMYFDEVYHARTAGEYIEGKPVFEWTHPPLPKELMALSILGFGGVGVRAQADAPPGMGDGIVTSDGATVVWAEPLGEDSGRLWSGAFSAGCVVRPEGPSTVLDMRPEALAVHGTGAYVSGQAPEGPVLARIEDGREVWRASLAAPAAQLAAVAGSVFVAGTDGSLWWTVDGEVEAVDSGVGHLAVQPVQETVWASFPDEGRVTSYAADGTSRVHVEEADAPQRIAAPEGSSRLLAIEDRRIASADTEQAVWTDTLALEADALVSSHASGLVWAQTGSELHLIEPVGLTVLGNASLPQAPDELLWGPEQRGVAALVSDELVCVGERAASAWRLGSALTGAAIAGLVLLIGVRLFGSMLAGAVAAFGVGVSGLAFTLSRIAMNDTYVTAFALAAAFCVLSALYRVGADTARSRIAASGWILGAGVFLGLALASKWVAAYAAVGLGLLLLWDASLRGREGIWGLAGGPVRTLGVFAVLLAAVPVAIYAASYLPHLLWLGDSAHEVVDLQRRMYEYHAHLTATHPFGSSWYGWPVGHRAVWVYAAEEAGRRAEIWIAPNPVLAFGGLGALVALGVAAWRRRQAALAVVPLLALAQFLPWTLVGRVTFLYHYLPVIPLLAVALGWWAASAQTVRARATRAALIGVLAALAFVLLLPILSGWSVPDTYHTTLRRLLPWMF